MYYKNYEKWVSINLGKIIIKFKTYYNYISMARGIEKLIILFVSFKKYFKFYYLNFWRLYLICTFKAL